jgi:DNA polymerase III subunit beta
MNFSTSRTRLIETLARVARVLPRASTNPNAGCVRVEAVDGRVRVDGSDIAASIAATIPAIVGSPGIFGVNAGALAERLKTMTDASVTMRLAGESLEVKGAGARKFKMRLVRAEDLPSPRALASADALETIPAATLTTALGRVIHAVCTDETRIHLHGVYVDATDGDAVLAATDGHRMASAIVTGWRPKMSGILHPLGVKALDGFTGSVGIRAEAAGFTFAAESVEVYSPAVAAVFPPWREFMRAAKTRTVAHVPADELKAALAAALTTYEVAEESSRMRVDVTAKEARLSCSSSLGEYEDSIPAIVDGPPMSFGAAPHYLAETVAAIGEAELSIGLDGPLDPILFTAKDGARFIVMPQRL